MNGGDLFLPAALVQAADALVEDGDWCLVRYTADGRFCGPLSLMTTDPGARYNLGFPHGHLGLIKLFTSALAAEACIETPVGEWNDRVTQLANLHFSLTEFSLWTRQSRVVYDGGDYRRAFVGWLLKRGIYTLHDNDGPNRFEAHIECRPVR